MEAITRISLLFFASLSWLILGFLGNRVAAHKGDEEANDMTTILQDTILGVLTLAWSIFGLHEEDL